jgi:hypothetical protein
MMVFSAWYADSHPPPPSQQDLRDIAIEHVFMLNMEVDLQSLFELLCTAVLIG